MGGGREGGRRGGEKCLGEGGEEREGRRDLFLEHESKDSA